MARRREDFVPLDRWGLGFQGPLVVAGPCSAEGEEQLLTTALALKQIPFVGAFRAGLWKARTRPGHFEGVGSKGLPWLAAVREKTGLPLALEVGTGAHVDLCLKHQIDILWVGARTSVNPFAVEDIALALAGTDVPVLVKNPLASDFSLWVGAIERLLAKGLRKLAAVHRGFADSRERTYRNAPLWSIPQKLKDWFPGLPLLCDPSHMAGRRELIPPLCRRALEFPVDGLMLECHHAPPMALSDGAQQLTPEALGHLLKSLAWGGPRASVGEMEKWRREIERIDARIIEALALRMDTTGEMALTKRAMGLGVEDRARRDVVLKEWLARGQDLGLEGNFLKDIYVHIHRESVKKQEDIVRERASLPLDKDSCLQ